MTSEVENRRLDVYLCVYVRVYLMMCMRMFVCLMMCMRMFVYVFPVQTDVRMHACVCNVYVVFEPARLYLFSKTKLQSDFLSMLDPDFSINLYDFRTILPLNGLNTEKKKKKNLLLVKMKEKKLLKMQSLPKVLRSQAMRSTT